jgi:hypothetical protein
METLIPFLKHSNALDLLVMILVILIAVILIPVGIWIAIASRTRKPIYFFLMIALLPLVFAVLGTYLRFRKIERVAAMFPDASAEVVAALRQEAWITTYIGAAGTALPGLIGLTGLVLKKDRKT